MIFISFSPCYRISGRAACAGHCGIPRKPRQQAVLFVSTGSFPAGLQAAETVEIGNKKEGHGIDG
jgi:hypothetical protein